MAEMDIERTEPLVDIVGFRLSWGAIFAGLVVATVLQVMLSVLGIAIGFGAWDADMGLSGLGLGAWIWFVATAIISLFVGGLVLGRLAGILKMKDGLLHGTVMWGLSVLLAVWMVVSGAGFLVGSTFNVLGRTAAAAAGGAVGAIGTVGAAAVEGGDIDLATLQRDIERILGETQAPALQPESLEAAVAEVRDTAATAVSNRELARHIAQLVRERAGAVDRQAIVNVVAAETDLTPQEANRLAERVENVIATAQNRVGAGIAAVEEEAGAIAAETSDALSVGAWLTLLAMVLSLGAALWGTAITARD